MKMNLLRTTALTLLMFFCAFQIYAQQPDVKSFSLQEAIDYAVTNGYKTRTAAIDLQATIAQRKGYISIGLPQINAGVNYQHYINIPTQFMPDFLTPVVEGTLVQHGLITYDQMTSAGDDKIPVQFGSTNNFSLGVTASQLLFDGTFIVGLKAASMLVDMSKTSVDKSINEIKASVAQAYYLVLVAQENRQILDSTYRKMNAILEQNKQFQKNGFIDETDVEQFSLTVSNLKNKLEMTDRNIDLVTDLLQFQMGMNIDEPVILKDNLKTLLDQAIASNIAEKQFDINNHFDYRLLKNQERLLLQTIKVDQSKYYPSLNMIFSSQSQAQREKFNFFNNEKWYNSTYVGINLSIPIWSSGIRYYKISQDKFALKKHQVTLKQVEDGLKIDVNNSKLLLKTYSDQFYTDKKNYELSQKIYDKTYSKFKEGMSSGMDLNQAYIQILTQQGTYLNTMLQLLNTYSNLSKALNTL